MSGRHTAPAMITARRSAGIEPSLSPSLTSAMLVSGPALVLLGAREASGGRVVPPLLGIAGALVGGTVGSAVVGASGASVGDELGGVTGDVVGDAAVGMAVGVADGAAAGGVVELHVMRKDQGVCRVTPSSVVITDQSLVTSSGHVSPSSWQLNAGTYLAGSRLGLGVRLNFHPAAWPPLHGAFPEPLPARSRPRCQWPVLSRLLRLSHLSSSRYALMPFSTRSVMVYVPSIPGKPLADQLSSTAMLMTWQHAVGGGGVGGGSHCTENEGQGLAEEVVRTYHPAGSGAGGTSSGHVASLFAKAA